MATHSGFFVCVKSNKVMFMILDDDEPEMEYGACCVPATARTREEILNYIRQRNCSRMIPKNRDMFDRHMESWSKNFPRLF